MKIILTSAQLPSTQQAATLATLQTVASSYANITVANAAAIHTANNVGPADGGHPSPRGAKVLADWIAGLVNSALAS
jgi:lysophospholipase L1-like esterase